MLILVCLLVHGHEQLQFCVDYEPVEILQVLWLSCNSLPLSVELNCTVCSCKPSEISLTVIATILIAVYNLYRNSVQISHCLQFKHSDYCYFIQTQKQSELQ